MNSPLVSILIPFKNTETYIEECLDSILEQNYQNWEAICINDHSEDQSPEMVKTYVKKDNRFQLFYNNGRGIIEALRLALEKSKGHYITRMDSDDVMLPNRIKTLCQLLKKYGKKHLAVGQVKYFRADGLHNGYKRYEKWINELTEKGTNYSEIYKECVIPSPCWMIDKEDLIACDAFNPSLYPEDYDLTFRFYKANYKCIPCSEVLLKWRDYSNRSSRTLEHYAQNYFLEIKTHYFLELDYNKTRPLILWGAGFKGKHIAKLLIENNIDFNWVCDNAKKIGKHIYNQKLHNFESLKDIKNPQTIVTVANDDAQKDIRAYFEELQMKSMADYFFFC